MRTKTSVTTGELDQMWNSGRKIVLIDVRSNAEFEENHIPDFLNIPIEKLEVGNLPREVARDTVIVTACGNGGGRSERAAGHLREKGRFQACSREGGTFAGQSTPNGYYSIERMIKLAVTCGATVKICIE